ncbi:MAG: flippase-like domain-containing protein [Bdellovibrionales bacterium]|nr:flippase-like domain-containing protein [Bdellovibrionales bacterium]
METSSKSLNPNESEALAPKVSPKERLKLFLKFALVAAVFFFLHQRGFITAESFRKLVASPLTWLFCTFLTILNTVLGALRWQVLLRTQDVVLSFREVFRLNMVGSFFNIALPGAVSGDFVKAVIVARKFREKRALIFGSMIFDRILGVSAMVFVGAISAILSVLVPWGGSLPQVLLVSIWAVGAGAAFFFVYLFLSHKKDPLLAVLQIFTRRSEKLGSIERLYQGVMGYRAHPRRILKAIGLSIAIHLFLILLAFFITKAISDQSLSVFAIAVVVPIGMLATTIPVLPAGVGTGHAAFLGLFHLVGSDQGAEVFSMIVLYQVLLGVIGGLVYLRMLAGTHRK